MGWTVAPATCVAEDWLVWHRREGRHLVLWRLDAPEKGDARGLRQEWGGTFLEAKGGGKG